MKTGCVLTVGLDGAVREYLLFTASVTVTVTVAILCFRNDTVTAKSVSFR